MAAQALRIVIVSWHFPPSQEIGGKVVWRLAKHLALLGCDVRVLVAPLSEVPYTDPEYASVLPEGLRVIRTSVDSDVLGNLYRSVKKLLTFRKAAPTAPSSEPEQPPITGRGLRDYIRRLLAFGRYDRWIKPAGRELRATLAEQPADLVMSVSPAFQAHLAVLRVRSQLKDIPWYVWMHDPGNHHMIETGAITSVLVGRHGVGRFLARRRAVTERRAIESATRMVVTSHRLADDYVKLLPQLRTPILVPCGFDAEESQCSAQPGSKLVLVYVGTIYASQTPRPIVESLARLRAAGVYTADELEVKFVGRLENEEGKQLKSVIEELGMDDVITSSPQVPHADALRFVASASVGIAMAEQLPTQIPAKMYEYIALRRPVLALADDGVTRDLVIENRLGYVCDRQGLDEALTALIAQWRSDRLAVFDPALEAAAQRYDMANIAKDLLDEIRSDVAAASRH
jgi:glycosyltransferase involved in cell wall biosynthesis